METPDQTSQSAHSGTALVGIEQSDLALLRQAHHLLEHPSLAARLSNVVGTPIEVGLHLLPRPWYARLHSAAELAISKAFDVATASLRQARSRDPRTGLYRGLAAGTGVAGGLLGLPGLALELPVTTTLMLRSIAEIARAEGEDMTRPEARLACLEVFALGGHSESDDAAETGYFGVRLALAAYIGSAIEQVGRHGLAAEGAPILVQLIRVIAARFGSEVSKRAAMRLIPVVGALGAAAVNSIFMQHYQDVARGHFIVRRLERRYGTALVRANYAALDRVD